MIPKIIHYCWFGVHPKPEKIENYINGWKETLPDYRFMEWNEDNFDIANSIPYVKEAYAAKKYAFVSDYVRVCALCEYGGVYLDTDVELRKDFSAFLDQADVLLCYESKQLLCTAFMAAVPEHPMLRSFRESYDARKFQLEDGTLDTLTVNQALTDHLRSKGVYIEERMHREADNIAIYLSEYFSGQDVDHGHPNITDNTYTVHRFEGSWNNKRKGGKKVKAVLKYKLIRPCLHKLLGYQKADKLLDLFRKNHK